MGDWGGRRDSEGNWNGPIKWEKNEKNLTTQKKTVPGAKRGLLPSLTDCRYGQTTGNSNKNTACRPKMGS